MTPYAGVDSKTVGDAVLMVRGLAWAQVVQEAMTARTGRPRIHRWDTLLVLCLIAAFENPGRLLVSEAARVADRLTPQQRAQIGLVAPLRYSHLQSALTDMSAALQSEVDPHTAEIKPARLPMGLTDLISSMISEFIPGRVPTPPSLAVDGTIYETWSKRRSWGRWRPDVDPGALPEPGVKAPVQGRGSSGWPRRGADGREQHTIDPDARAGYLPSKNMVPKSTFNGWELHLFVDVATSPKAASRREAAVTVPPLIRALSVVPAGSDRGAAGLAALDAMLNRGAEVNEVLADRGYSFLKPERWARPLASRGVQQVIDLHPNQRGVHPGPIPETVMIDGAVYTTAMPEHLWDLPAEKLKQPAAEKSEVAARFDQRRPYAFSTQGNPDPERGTQRYRGPALAGRLRCPNSPKSMRKSPAKVPTSNCKKGQSCACGKTVTLGPSASDRLQIRQRELYGTTRWKLSYSRRNAVESANSLLKNHYARLTRGSTQVRGTHRTAILLALIIATVNMHLLRRRYGYDLACPPPGTGTVPPLPMNQSGARRRRVFTRPRRSSGSAPPESPPPLGDEEWAVGIPGA